MKIRFCRLTKQSFLLRKKTDWAWCTEAAEGRESFNHGWGGVEKQEQRADPRDSQSHFGDVAMGW